jgi:hypothetical protein
VGFLEEWFAIWRDAQGRRSKPDDAWDRLSRMASQPDYLAVPALKRALERLDEQRFSKLSRFLGASNREATNNGARADGSDSSATGSAPLPAANRRFHRRQPPKLGADPPP